MRNTGVKSIGIRLPILKEGDNLKNEVVNAVLNATLIDSRYENVDDPTKKCGYSLEKVSEYDLNDRDVIGITESIVARTAGNYVTVDEIADRLSEMFGHKPMNYVIVNPIYSRNRFSMILKGIARVADKIQIVMPSFDEVGNPCGENPFTGVDIERYYFKICQKEGVSCETLKDNEHDYDLPLGRNDSVVLYCGLHDYKEMKDKYNVYNNFITLADIFSDKCEYGLLGSNKATEEKLKLFPSKTESQKLVEDIQKDILRKTGKKIEVMVYGDGCFKDPVGGIWEFADPVVSPAFTDGLVGKPNEIKIKAFADDKFKDLTKSELTKAIKEEIKSKKSDLVGNMASQGTTPRRYVDLLGSLMDLTSGSGDKGTPVVLVQNYFDTFATE